MSVSIIQAEETGMAGRCAAVPIQCRENERVRMDGGAQFGRSGADCDQADIDGR